MSLGKETTGVILLGATEFPDSNQFQGSDAFFNAKERIKSFFLQKFYQTVACDSILDLFDLDASPGDMLLKIAGFIRNKKSSITDLILYYVGHGGFDKEFFLAIRKTNDQLLAATSLTAKDLGGLLSNNAYNLRIILILDCCFAAEMYKSFQSPVKQLVNKQISDNFPKDGIVLLCSSSKDMPSVIIEERTITMFTEGFEKALLKGDPAKKNKYLTLNEIRDLTYTWINQYNAPKDVVRPEVHSPYIPSGEIADKPLFENYGFNPDGLEIAYNLKIRLLEIRTQIIGNNLKLAASLFSDFVNDVLDDVEADFELVLNATLLAAECNSLEDDKPIKNHLQQSEDSHSYKMQSELYAVAYKNYLDARFILYRRMLEFCYTILKKFK